MHVPFRIHYRNNLIDKKRFLPDSTSASWDDRNCSYGNQLYPSGNGSDMIIPFCRLSNYTYDSFINSLDPSLRNVDSIAKFKTELRKQKDISQVPTHYEIVPRKLNIILTQLRCFASFLNYDLF